MYILLMMLYNSHNLAYLGLVWNRTLLLLPLIVKGFRINKLKKKKRCLANIKKKANIWGKQNKTQLKKKKKGCGGRNRRIWLLRNSCSAGSWVLHHPAHSSSPCLFYLLCVIFYSSSVVRRVRRECTTIKKMHPTRCIQQSTSETDSWLSITFPWMYHCTKLYWVHIS